MPRLHPQPLDDLAAEMHALGREYSTVIDETRAEWLEQRIVERRELRVRRTRTNRSGERVTLRLDDGTVVELELLVAERARLATVSSVRRRCSDSWIVRGRTAAGDHVTYLASRVRIVPASCATPIRPGRAGVP